MKKKKGGGGGEKKNANYTLKADFFFTVIIVLLFGTIDQNRDRFRRDHTLVFHENSFEELENRLISAREFFPTCSSFLFPVYIYTYSLEKGFVHGEVDEKFPSRLQRHELAALSVDINPLALPLPIPWE